jgi:hypothetical protein
MRKLFENWREFLSEAEISSPASRISNLVGPPKFPNLLTVIDFNVFGSDGFRIFYNTYKKQFNPNTGTYEFENLGAARRATPAGVIQLVKIDPNEKAWGKDPFGECYGAYKVNLVIADKGWGPLLYDVAIEVASMKGYGIVPDRVSITPPAQKLWQIYLDSRPDVSPIQLDDLSNFLTPNIKDDNCNLAILTQFIDQVDPRHKIDSDDPETWNKFVKDNPKEAEEIVKGSPFSKIYKKNNYDVLEALKKQNRFDKAGARRLSKFVGKDLFGQDYQGQSEPEPGVRNISHWHGA